VKRHLLVTNDFPPKVGGIQNYLWDLWSRLDPSSYVVLTASSDEGAAAFDTAQAERGIRIERVPGKILFFPTPDALAAVRAAVKEHEVDMVLLDPALPLGLLGPQLDTPYGVVLHGAEVTVPGRLPGSRAALARVLRQAELIVSAGRYPATGPLLTSVSRLVPRKGMDVLIEAANRLAPSYPDLVVAIAGDGRELGHLREMAARSPVAVKVLGRVSQEDRAALLGAADIFVMACHNRWLGLEQEGFGIVFLEAAAAGVPQVAGDSGGASEAVLDGETGLVVDNPRNPGALAEALRTLLADPTHRRRMGRAARSRVQESFDNDVLASRLADALAGVAI
jgi:phosphatidylinositol alpha-1,6-mannosyltransferase